MSLKNDIAKFSAFKETSFRKELESYLTENGKVVPWSEYKKKADALNIDYNKRYLKTEYHHTVATAISVEKWKSFEADSDLYPNLKYNAINDGRTREQHREWDGLVLPINHPFWKTHMTPNDWGCRCDVEQTDEEVSTHIPDNSGKTGFNNNAALSGKVFGEIAYKEGLSKKEIEKAERLATRLLEVENYKTSVLKTFKNGGQILSDNLVNINSSDYADLFKCCEFFAKKGNVTKILPRVNLKSPLYSEIYGKLIGTAFEGKCPDFMVNGLFYELEGFEVANAQSLSNMFKRGLKQSSRLVLMDDGSTINHYLKVINFRIKEGQKIDEVWILRKTGKIEQVY